MVYPNGIEGSWAGPSYHNGSTVGEDVKFIEDVIADVTAKLCVDDGKIYAAGYVFSVVHTFLRLLLCSHVSGCPTVAALSEP